MKYRMRDGPGGGGFTLVELLVVVGIIALLVALLLPALNRARESANRAQCASNLRMLAMAFVQYANDNRGYFPAAARNNRVWAEDWLHWLPGRDMRHSAIGKWLSARQQPFDRVMRCPSDQADAHPPTPFLGNARYPFSYTMNAFLECRLPETDGLATVYFRRPAKLERIRNAPLKALLLEESQVTINDGATAIVGFPTPPGSRPIPGPTDWLAVRHDSGVVNPDSSTAAGWPIPNPARRGNVAFADGHVAFATRREIHSVEGRSWDLAR